MRTRNDLRGIVTPEVAKRIRWAAGIYLKDYKVKISDLARIRSSKGDSVSEKTLRENLFVTSKNLDSNLHQLILERDMRKCEYLAKTFIRLGNLNDVSIETGFPTSTVHEIITKRISKYPELDDLALEVFETIEYVKKHRTESASQASKRMRAM